MLHVLMRGRDLHPVAFRTGERLLFGRDPHNAVDAGTPGVTAIRLPGCAPHVSAVVAELVVGVEAAWIRWLGAGEGRLSSLFDAPGGARRVTLTRGLRAMLDGGKNELLILSGRKVSGLYADFELTFLLSGAVSGDTEDPLGVVPHGLTEPKPHLKQHRLAPHSKEWYVALALAEPWLAGQDDAPFPPTNRRIYERILHWRGEAWNLERSQRVDDAIRSVSRIAFGELEDPYAEARTGRIQNPRYAVGKRVADYQLVTSDDLDAVERAAAGRET
ncbi:hypothetical protein [Flindersiella endophytica]